MMIPHHHSVGTMSQATKDGNIVRSIRRVPIHKFADADKTISRRALPQCHLIWMKTPRTKPDERVAAGALTRHVPTFDHHARCDDQTQTYKLGGIALT